MEEKKKYHCRKCGYDWNPKSKDSKRDPVSCPWCKSYHWKGGDTDINRMAKKINDRNEIKRRSASTEHHAEHHNASSHYSQHHPQ